MKLQELQNQLDVKKYIESERFGKDLCGAYFYCKHCNKKNKFPCASAYKKIMKTLEGKEQC